MAAGALALPVAKTSAAMQLIASLAGLCYP